MVKFEEIKKYVDETIKKITIDAKGLAEATTRSSDFLVASSILTHYLKETQEEIAKAEAETDASYAHAIQSQEGNKITEKKIGASTNVDYTRAKLKLAELEATRDWIKGFIRIFDNAHITYRQLQRS